MALQWRTSRRRMVNRDHGTIRVTAEGARGHTYQATNQLHGASWLASVEWGGRIIAGRDFGQRSGAAARQWCEDYEAAVVAKARRPAGYGRSCGRRG